MSKAERGQTQHPEEEAGAYQRQFPECFYQPADQPALQDDAEHAQVGVNVADFFRPERMSVPFKTSLGKQRKARHEHRERQSESKELPQPWRQVRLAKVPGVI